MTTHAIKDIIEDEEFDTISNQTEDEKLIQLVAEKFGNIIYIPPGKNMREGVFSEKIYPFYFHIKNKFGLLLDNSIFVGSITKLLYLDYESFGPISIFSDEFYGVRTGDNSFMLRIKYIHNLLFPMGSILFMTKLLEYVGLEIDKIKQYESEQCVNIYCHLHDDPFYRTIHGYYLILYMREVKKRLMENNIALQHVKTSDTLLKTNVRPRRKHEHNQK